MSPSPRPPLILGARWHDLLFLIWLPAAGARLVAGPDSAGDWLTLGGILVLTVALAVNGLGRMQEARRTRAEQGVGAPAELDLPGATLLVGLALLLAVPQGSGGERSVQLILVGLVATVIGGGFVAARFRQRMRAGGR